MLFIYYLSKPTSWIIPWIIQAFIYYRLLRKMGLNVKWAFVPFVAEGEMSKRLFRLKTTFWHVFVFTAIFLGGGFYLRYTRGNAYAKIIGIVFTLIALLIYSAFLTVLYQRLCEAFHKKLFFRVGTFFVPMLFLFILGSSKSVFYGFPEYKPIIKNRYLRLLVQAAGELVFFAEAIGILFGVSFLSTALYPPRPMVYLNLAEKQEKIKDLEGDGRVISRYDTTGLTPADLDELYKGRDPYFADHTNDESVVVLEYIIGSNLEDTNGLSSYNIAQMKEATKNGPALKFVLDAGGSYRWFTSGIKDETNGRYEIAAGELRKVSDVDKSVSMSKPDELYDFLTWAKKEYPADRYMLVFWDHGGGLSSGFGSDDLNKREDTEYGSMMVDEIIDVLEKAGMKFDLIGFDACLMQDIEIARALEPYADYYLASQETESGDGWYYTSGFGLLAKDPTTSTEDFAREMISSFDLYNAIANNGEAQSETTLSLIDLTKIADTYDALESFYDQLDEAMRDTAADYADISLAASHSYAFSGKEQIDLIDFLQKLDTTDYDDTILSEEQITELINRVNASVVCRNAVANTGINGIAVTFPYNSLDTYGAEHTQFEALDLRKTMRFYDDYFSIMAYMHKGNVSEIFGIPLMEEKDHTQDEWYVKDFDGYADIPLIVDIPLIEQDDAYQIDLDDNVWNIISYSRQVMYQKADRGWRYLGQDVAGALDENDHPMVSTDGTWIHINNNLVAYETEDPVETEWGVLYKGKVKARLNGQRDIIVHIEWEPVEPDSPQDISGKVTGYEFADSEWLFRDRGVKELNPGDSIEFLFDLYDEEGKYVATETYGRNITVSTMDALKVRDLPLEEGDYRYGVILTDVFQRTFTTQMIETHLPK